MSFDDIKMLLSQPETLNEGLAELDTYNNSLLSTVDELKDSNNKYIGFSDGIHDAEYDELTYRK